MEYFPMRKEFPLEDQSRLDKDDEMFGRGGALSPGNESINQATKSGNNKEELFKQ